ncbi:F0F1 ATP synthase subunit A [Terrilactibacillus sp. BCM23-1]|uniref:ATP synthase subunit a n=1 Tax=Terrilactibacillus tamarindi TaxID=2599694 RepID=A0A6N8CPC5_9BACI|nr:F0F1 ATP synthase subunit A [Terrilactibacillus tamarindi]MTT30997.1 F0F1 ATP synthase subunit A [Terrilactibacillus tamarindi]
MEITPKLTFLGMTFDLTVMIGTTIAALLVIILVFFLTRKLTMRPTGKQNIMEMIVDFIRGITNMMLEDKQAAKYLSFAITTFLFILVANMLGVIVMINSHGAVPAFGLTGDAEVSWFKSPTSDINVTVALAFAISLYAHFAGIRKNPRGYVAHYFKPYWPMFPLHIIDELAKPTTHAARLWANIFAGEVLITILVSGAPYLTALPLFAWLGFSIFVGCIQAYIFTVLAIVYISQQIASDH